MALVINIPSQLPALAGKSLFVLRVNASESGTEWANAGGITIGTTPIASGAINRILFQGAGAVIQQNSNFIWDNTNNRMVLGVESLPENDVRLAVIGKGVGTNKTFSVHNATGISNTLVALDNGNVGIRVANPLTPLQIGNVYNFNITVSQGQSAFNTRIDQNSNTIWGLENRTNAANAEAIIMLRGFDETTTLSHTSPSYTNNYNGSEGRASVLYTKLQNVNSGKQKFAISNIVNASINKFEWISAVAPNGNLTNGFGTTPPIMTLVGNGNLLLGTVTDEQSSLLTLESINKGFLPPRMTTAQKSAIATPARGLIVYDTTLNKLCVYTTAWEVITSI